MKLPQPSTNNLWYRDCPGPVIVFLHGVLSDSRGCWLHPDADPAKNIYWPELICSDRRFDGIAVYLGGYYTAFDAGPYEIRNCSDEVFSALARRDAGKPNSVLDRDTIILVCHSTGGIVARYMLDTHSDAFVQKRIGLVLIASPSLGAKDANRLSLTRRSRNQTGRLDYDA
jgi:pimeloyl-ACP methyl ester carboxylesterase